MILAALSAGRSRFPACIHGKDKTFFFVSYEGLRLTAPQAATINYCAGCLPLRAGAPAAPPPATECLSGAKPEWNG